MGSVETLGGVGYIRARVPRILEGVKGTSDVGGNCKERLLLACPSMNGA